MAPESFDNTELLLPTIASATPRLTMFVYRVTCSDMFFLEGVFLARPVKELTTVNVVADDVILLQQHRVKVQ